MDSVNNEEFDFNQLPEAIKNELLARHLKRHIELVDDLTEDLGILFKRFRHTCIELKITKEQLQKREAELEQSKNFIFQRGLGKAFHFHKYVINPKGGGQNG